MTRTTCCIIGGGPAGMVLGLLLARTGVEVTVLEKHGDFLRDFRGDTVHPTTLHLLDDLGLAEKFAALPARRLDRVQLPVGTDEKLVTFGDFSTLKDKYNYVAMVPQWDFLDLLAEAGRGEPGFTLRMNTEATGLIREGGRVNGVHYRTADGRTGEIRATITVACDGRSSLVRGIPELGLQDFATPMDVRWFAIERRDTDPEGAIAKVGSELYAAIIDRGHYWQCASLITKGTDVDGRDAPIERFNDVLRNFVPWFNDGRPLLTSWDEVKLLSVRLDRLRRWHLPGLLCIGDAAHAMSPLGGVGINLAVQDAVAAARHLAVPLRDGRLERRHVAAIQRRRMPTTQLIQGFQRLLHHNVVDPAVAGEIDFDVRIPLPLRILPKIPWFKRVPPYLFAYGAMRERPPAEALR